ncbi:MAG: S1C family serine protease [Bacillota bacterium]
MGLYDDPYREPHRAPRSSGGKTIAVALISALVGGVASSYIAPMYLYGRYLPYPPSYTSNQQQPNYQLPQSNTPTTPPTASLPAQVAVTGPAERVTPAVVGITNKVLVRDFFGQRTRLVERGSGSGAIFDAKGYIFTNHHVVEGAAELVVKLANGQMVPGTLVGSDSYMDLAVVKINPADAGQGILPVVEFGNSSTLKVGEMAVAIGNPLGLERTVTAGIISGLNRAITVEEDRQMELLQTDAAINAGNSGGPLVNAAGQVVGINTIKLAVEGVEGMGFAIPINTARQVLEDLINYGRVIRPYLGITGQVIDAGWAQQYKLPVDYGIYVEINANTPAQRAGLKDGDIIIKMENEKITSFDQFLRILYQKRPGETIKLTIMRGKQEMVVPVTLAEQPR